MNVAFRGVDERAQYNLAYRNPSPQTPTGQGAWFEDRQAAALAAGDVSAFGYTVATADLRSGVTRKHRVGPGLHERVYTSAYTMPAESGPPTESMSYVGVKGRGTGGAAPAFAQVFNLLGRYQPYGVYVPRVGPERALRPADGVARQQPGHRRPDQPAGHAAGVRRGPRPAARHAGGPRAQRLRLRPLRARPARRHGRRRAHLPGRRRPRLLQRLQPGRLHHVPHGVPLPAPVRRLHRLGAVHRRRHQRDPGRRGRRRRGHGRRRRQHAALRRQRPARARRDAVRRRRTSSCRCPAPRRCGRRSRRPAARSGGGSTPPPTTSRSRCSTTGARRPTTRPASGGCTTRPGSPSGRRPSSTPRSTGSGTTPRTG